MNSYNITAYLTHCILTRTPVAFSKFGDGEYLCAIGKKDCNSDMDIYTEKLREKLQESFRYMVCNHPNAYIGKWHTKYVTDYWESLTPKNTTIKWANYHSIILDLIHENSTDEERQFFQQKIILWKTVKQSNLKKIIVCNPLLEKSALLLYIDYILPVPFQNWFDNYFEKVLDTLKQTIDPNEQHIIITCCGMSAKVLIYELSKLYPNNIFLDFGSALDLICTKRNSRGTVKYEDVISVPEISELIPDNWNDPKYDYIYEEAKRQMGIILPGFIFPEN
jgi:hypothetical protein